MSNVGKRPFTWVIVLWLLAFGVAGMLPLAATRATSATARPHSAPLTVVAPPTPLPLPLLQAQAAYLFDPAADRVLYSYDANVERPMASTTKIMTAVVAILLGNPDQVITIPADIGQLAGADASLMCCPMLQVGQRFTLRDLLYGLLLPSGDDAAIAIADGVAGSQAAFVIRMNQVAHWLGMTQTQYVNAHGLDAPGHYTTAYDLARLGAFALELPLFRQIVAQSHYRLVATPSHPAIDLTNSNQLLMTGARLGVAGVKTGFTGNAGYCLVLDAWHDGHDLVAVLMGDPTSSARFADGAALLAWGFTSMAPPVLAP
jgi:D-alanyl-D-alanine carboxypeptidase (penicillin-binding protein 5/6)